jgi:glutathione S-transferase
MVQGLALQYCTLYSTIQYSTVVHCTVLYSTYLQSLLKNTGSESKKRILPAMSVQPALLRISMELTFSSTRCAPVLASLLCGEPAPVALVFSAGSPPILRCPGIGVLTAPIAAAVRIVSAAGKRSAALLGLDDLQRLEISEWLEFAAGASPQAVQSKLSDVLLVRTYLAGASFSLADVIAFASIAGEDGAVGSNLSGYIYHGSPLDNRVVDLPRSDTPVSVRRWLGLCEERLPLGAADALAAPASPLSAVAGGSEGKGPTKPRACAEKASGKSGSGAAADAAAKRPGGSDKPSEPKAPTNIGGGGKDGSMPVLKGTVEHGALAQDTHAHFH